MRRQLIRAVTGLATAGLLATFAAGTATAKTTPVPPREAQQSAAAAKATAPYCGPTIRKASGAPWRCTFADDFSGRALDPTKWLVNTTTMNGFRVGPECYVDSPDNVRVSNGRLLLTARKEARPLTCQDPFGGDFTTEYTSGNVTSWGRFTQTYGRFEFRAKFPATTVPGVHSALWLYHQNNTYGAGEPSGEIDVAEYYTQYPDLPIPYVHYSRTLAEDPNMTAWNCVVPTAGTRFHTYVLEWDETTLKISYDGRTCLVDRWIPTPASASPTAPFDQPFFLMLTQALGTGTNVFDPSRTQLPATMEIDWVRAWA